MIRVHAMQVRRETPTIPVQAACERRLTKSVVVHMLIEHIGAHVERGLRVRVGENFGESRSVGVL